LQTGLLFKLLEATPQFLRAGALLSVLLLLPLTACIARREPIDLQAKPTPQVPRWAGLTETDPGNVRNSYRHLVPPSSVNVLPCRLAVARVEPVAGDGKPPRIILAADPQDEFVRWSEMLDDTTLILETFPITYPIYTDREIHAKTILQRARSFDAGLLLIYRETIYPNVAAEIHGVIYEVATGRVLAAIHAEASAPDIDPENPPPPPPGRTELDMRHINARFLALNRFEHLVRQCFLDWIELYNRREGKPNDVPKTTRLTPNRPQQLSAGDFRPNP